jgi:hypothetical protein
MAPLANVRRTPRQPFLSMRVGLFALSRGMRNAGSSSMIAGALAVPPHPLAAHWAPIVGPIELN